MLRVSGISIKYTASEQNAVEAALRKLKLKREDLLSWRVSKKSLDARDKSDIRAVYSLDLQIKGDEGRILKRLPRGTAKAVAEPGPLKAEKAVLPYRPKIIIAGLGPAGLFAALYLSRAGLSPLVLERGKPTEERKKDADRFALTGELDTDSNIQFGEGGAGAFSDGKLTTGIKDERCAQILYTLYEHGAPEEILYAAHPHVGTDRLPGCVSSIRREIEKEGGKVLFSARLTKITAEKGTLRAVTWKKGGETFTEECDALICAVGHSAADTQQMLYSAGVDMIQKPFSVGARIEHPQALINRAQWGDRTGQTPQNAAEYRLSCHLPSGRGAYTFCMCPGGTVVPSASREGGVCTNGMSTYARDGVNANSALLIDVHTEDFPDSHPLAGYILQREWEEKAFRAGGGGYKAPVQRVEDLLAGRESTRLGDVCPTYRPGVTCADLRTVLPSFAVNDMKEAIRRFDTQLRGFGHPDAVLTAVESRSSCPVRVVRNEKGESSIRGLFPCGEGAGYAGGIMSAAADGIRQAINCIAYLKER